MICFKVLVFSFLLIETLVQKTQAACLADLIITNSTTNQTASLTLGACPACICQCVPVIFPSCPTSVQSLPSTQAPTVNTTLAPTQSPTTLPPTTTTTLGPQLNVCTAIYQVKTASNTNLKMLCYVAGNAKTTENAAIFCANNRMKFYELTDADSVAGYQQFVNSYVTVGGPAFAANGILINGKWMSFTNQTVPLYSGITWGASRATAATPPPIFLYIRESNMAFIGYAYNYDSAAYFMCEY